MKTVKNVEEKKNKITQVNTQTFKRVSTEPVPSPVCVSCECVQFQRISPLPLSSFIQIATSSLEPQELNLLTCRDKEECPAQHRRTWSDRSDGWRNRSSQYWRWMDRWEKQPSSEDKSEAEGKESLYPCETQEDWRESRSGGYWKNRQYEGCNAETLRKGCRALRLHRWNT